LAHVLGLTPSFGGWLSRRFSENLALSNLGERQKEMYNTTSAGTPAPAARLKSVLLLAALNILFVVFDTVMLAFNLTGWAAGIFRKPKTSDSHGTGPIAS
jgi:hypothetical protein